MEGVENDVVGFIAVVGCELEAVVVGVVEEDVGGAFVGDDDEDGGGRGLNKRRKDSH